MAKPKFTTPIGIVKFPNIEKPDAKGKYRIALVLDPKTKEFGDMQAQIAEAEKDFEKKYRGKPMFKTNYEIENGEKKATEMVLMNFGSSFPLFNEKECKIFDAKCNPVKTDIGWGSKCRVSFTLSPFDQDGNVGITKYIHSIQIIDLKTSSVTAESCGFKQEDGYVSEDKQKEMPKEEKDKLIQEGVIAWDE